MRRIPFIALFITLFIGAVCASLAHEVDPSEFVFTTKLGALEYSARADHVAVFHTYQALTKGKEVVKDWATTKGFEKDLTDLGLDLHNRLMKLEDVAAVRVSYRAISIQKFRLSTWENLVPTLKGLFE